MGSNFYEQVDYLGTKFTALSAIFRLHLSTPKHSKGNFVCTTKPYPAILRDTLLRIALSRTGNIGTGVKTNFDIQTGRGSYRYFQKHEKKIFFLHNALEKLIKYVEK